MNGFDQRAHPVVLRFEGLWPHQLGGYEMHRHRSGRDLEHVDSTRSPSNARLLGEEDWAVRAQHEIEEMRFANFELELEGLERRKRRADLKRRLAEGPRDPWRASQHGPMRELILTASKDWFAEDMTQFFGQSDRNQREARFETCAVDWLKTTFGDDVIHARADHDEAAYHIHAVILPRSVTMDDRQMLQPSAHPVIEDYEFAQDSVGAWFGQIGLVRGERRAKAIREARANGETPSPKRHHARTAQWRANEELRLKQKAEALELQSEEVEAREAEADTVLAVADAIAEGAIEIDGTAEASKLKADPSKMDKPLLTRLNKSRAGWTRASADFAAAWKHLSVRAEHKAQEALRDDVDEIRAADDEIVAIAKMLPDGLRGRIAAARKSLSRRIVGLKRRFDRSDERNAPERRE